MTTTNPNWPECPKMRVSVGKSLAYDLKNAGVRRVNVGERRIDFTTGCGNDVYVCLETGFAAMEQNPPNSAHLHHVDETLKKYGIDPMRGSIVEVRQQVNKRFYDPQ